MFNSYFLFIFFIVGKCGINEGVVAAAAAACNDSYLLNYIVYVLFAGRVLVVCKAAAASTQR